ncbi:cholecystokinin receptor-like isoform X2 [Liolophura sinensis]|uniref:cholecystokinin receptor-like isoform X2 n=1 Tax=Liolophura sinensis TaxID=3198878 RepID=UPI003158E0F0
MGGNGSDNSTDGGLQSAELSWEIQIPLYCLIFLLAVVGNFLVIITIIQNKRMRTVTNVFLLNLSISDLLLAVFCMPFTFVPIILKNFIFGATMCVMIRYLQGVSVGVSCFTLVTISMERYFAICRPLSSRSWQTLSHAYRAIGVCWIVAGAIMIPIAVHTRYGPIRIGYACREIWPNKDYKLAYTVLIDLVLLLFPLLIMSLAYGMIARTLWMGIQLDKKSEKGLCCFSAANGGPSEEDQETYIMQDMKNNGDLQQSKNRRKFDYGRGVRQSNAEKTRASKKRVIRMLFVIVLEFFICWTPLYVVITWKVFDYRSAHQHISSFGDSFIYLLAYVSSCCNPITYCFMHKKFRQSFITTCKCGKFCVRKSLKRRNQFSISGQSSIRTVATETGSLDVSHDNQ